MIDPKRLLADLKVQVRNLEQDLRQNEDDLAKLRIEWEEARERKRTATTFETWLDDRVTQAAVAWVLGTVFVRFCEDNGLLDDVFIAGPRDQTAQARERQEAYFQIPGNQGKTDREWLKAAFKKMAEPRAAQSLFADQNPMNSIAPSQYGAKALIDFWRRTRPEGDEVVLVHDFTHPKWDTRFLGDLYEKLSDAARDNYALLQTPEFVEKFILEKTLDPAIEEFGLDPNPPKGHDGLPHRLRTIDPACGSGHFLLGAFSRLLEAWKNEYPGGDRYVLVKNALESVHGVDKNPYAAAIARFRLLIAAMREAGLSRLTKQVDFDIYVAVGDSLLLGYREVGRQEAMINEQGEVVNDGDEDVYQYSTEDIDIYIKSAHIAGFGSYHAVYANPPYITVRDKAEGDLYRKRYPSCYREYSLSVPFAERIFKLAILGPQVGGGAGYTGQITANSFMKREFGKRLIEEFFQYRVDLTRIIDTSGAYIPGHGTPTVILLGRWRFPRPGSTIRAALGVQGEPGQPVDPAYGYVWQAIVSQSDRPGSESQWVTVADVPRARFAKHPWSLSGGGADELKMLIESAPGLLGEAAVEIGFGAVTREDDAYMLGAGALRRFKISAENQRAIVEGEKIRDFSLLDPVISLWPYDATSLQASASRAVEVLLWPYRAILRNRVAYGHTQIERGLTWFEYSMFFRVRFKSPYVLALAFVATHNHFALDRGGDVFKQSAPVVRLPEEASEDQYLALLGILNSSTACFWLKQVSHDKGAQGINEGFKSQEWERFYEFTGTKLEKFPLPAQLPLEFGRRLDYLAQQLSTVDPSSVCSSELPTRERLDVAQAEHERIRGRMIALQEELDWDVYYRYGLISDAQAAQLVANPAIIPEVKPGERAFEIVLAQRMRDEGFETQWFDRHRSTPITEIPAHWPAEYRAVVEARIKIIHDNRNIGLIERPECKRRWQSEEWGKKVEQALTNWLLDRCEQRDLWFGPDEQPVPMTVNRLADRLREDSDVVSVARLLKDDPDGDLAQVLTEILADEHVPYLARFRYKAEGMVKRAQWERTWDLQREEDAVGERLDIPVPRKYKNSDFQRSAYWRNRGKLDVPRERFISYLSTSPDSDKSTLLGWAGWDHREQALALYALIEERQNVDGWGTDRVKPLVQGLAEVMPWVRQWHNEVDQAFGGSVADELDRYLAAQRQRHGLTE